MSVDLDLKTLHSSQNVGLATVHMANIKGSLENSLRAERR